MSDRKVRRRRFGDRPDGRLLRTLDPLYCVTPYIMKKKSAASNMFSGTMDITETDRYIRARRKEGMPHLGILHFFIAVFVRTVSQYPAINRFIAGQKIYSRDNIPVNLSLKKEMTTDGQETTVKAYFDPADTMRDVYDKMQAMIDEGKQKGDANGTDKYARLFRFIPGLLLKFVVWFLELLDYFGIMPKALLHVSPFHGSMFISDLGSVGIPPVYHHLYDFGNIPVFICFGAKRREKFTNSQGETEERTLLDFTVVLDERICDGFYFSRAFRMLRKVFKNPEMLDVPPETVVEDVE